MSARYFGPVNGHNVLELVRMLQRKYGGSYNSLVEFYNKALDEHNRLSNAGDRVLELEAELKKGDVALLILRRRWEYWVAVTGLMKLGVTVIPGSLQLTKKDIAYRANAAGVSVEKK